MDIATDFREEISSTIDLKVSVTDPNFSMPT